jgi:hypothetical protein
MEIMLEIPKKGPRSIKLNNYYWKVVTPMVKEGLFNAGHMEVKSKDDAHVVIKNLFLTKKEDQEEPSTRILSNKEFIELLQKIQIWAAEYLSVVIPDPNQDIFLMEE